MYLGNDDERSSARGDDLVGNAGALEKLGSKLKLLLYGTVHSALKCQSLSLVQYFILLLICSIQLLYYPFHPEVECPSKGVV